VRRSKAELRLLRFGDLIFQRFLKSGGGELQGLLVLGDRLVALFEVQQYVAEPFVPELGENSRAGFGRRLQRLLDRGLGLFLVPGLEPRFGDILPIRGGRSRILVRFLGKPLGLGDGPLAIERL
jgi:hypothetical protein